MLVQHKVSTDENVTLVPTRPILNALRVVQRSLPRLKPSRRHKLFNDDREPGVETDALFRRPRESVDVIYLHWIARLLSTRLIAELSVHYRCPLVWVPMDIEPMTGGCHFAGDCKRFAHECGCCPLLGSDDTNDRSHGVWQQKKQRLSVLPITFVSGTTWMTRQIRESSLFGSHAIEEIALPIETANFSPEHRDVARRRWDLPSNRKIIMIGAQRLHDPRKGMRELLAALEHLRGLLAVPSRSGEPHEHPLLMVVGSGAGVFENRLPFEARFIDQITNRQDLATAYRCADLYVCPSIDDAGPMMIPEAMLCGTPVVAFDMGGAPDLIRNGVTGYMARLHDTEDLAVGMFRVLTEYPDTLGSQAVAAAYDRHHPPRVAARHVAMCEALRATASSRGDH